jgi:serine/threonine protein kinase
MNLLGYGSYGKVYKRDEHTALKVSPLRFKDNSDLNCATISELVGLQRARDCHVPYVTEVLSMDVNRDTNETRVIMPLHYYVDTLCFSDEMVRAYISQIIVCIASLHKVGIYHGDIKYCNMLFLKDMSEIRMIDFGLCCVDAPPRADFVLYTRSYRAPEVLLKQYKYKIETAEAWAAGVLICELLCNEACLFSCDNRYQVLGYQLQCIARDFSEVKCFNHLREWRLNRYKIQRYMNDTHDGGGNIIKYICQKRGYLAADLVSKLLTIDPAARYTVSGLLNHEYILPEVRQKYFQVMEPSLNFVTEKPPAEYYKTFFYYYDAMCVKLTFSCMKYLHIPYDDHFNVVSVMDIVSTLLNKKFVSLWGKDYTISSKVVKLFSEITKYLSKHHVDVSDNFGII